MTFLNALIKNKVSISLICILLLASFLRLYRISDYMTFLGDEGRDLIEVRKILSGNLVFLGPRSSAADFYYGPIYFYLITPFLFLANFDPVGPAIFIALLGIATVYLVYYAGELFFGTAAGLIAASLYAVSPLVIAYSRSSWNPNPMPFVALSAFLLAYKYFKLRSKKLLLVCGILLGIAIQLQYLAIFLIIIISGYVSTVTLLVHKNKMKVLGHIRLQLNNLIILFIGFVIGWSPFLAFELKHKFPNLKTILNYILFGSGQKTYAENLGFIENIQYVSFKIFSRLITRFPPPEQVSLNENNIILIWQIFTVLIGALSIIAIFRIKDKLTQLLLFFWFFAGIVLFGFYKGEIYDYYLGFIFPLPFLLIGNLLDGVFHFDHKRLNKFKKLYSPTLKSLAILIFLFLFFINLDGNPFKYLPNRQKDQVRKIAEFVISKTNEKPYNFALLTKGNSDHGYKYYLDLLGHPPITIQYEQIDPRRTSVTEQLMVVCEDPECQPVGNGLWEIAGFGQAEIVGKWQVSVVKVFKLTHYKN